MGGRETGREKKGGGRVSFFVEQEHLHKEWANKAV